MKRYLPIILLLFILYPAARSQEGTGFLISGNYVDLSFEEFAGQIKERYGIVIFYKPEWIENITVSARGDSINLELLLTQLLHPEGIHFLNKKNGQIFLTGYQEIDDFEIRIFTTTGVFKNESVSADDPMSPGEAQEINTTFSGFTGSEIQQVKFIPKLKRGAGQYTSCQDVALKYEEVLDC